ncbi:hypothetical protein JTE90_009734 [Oedothorax gibbosus]|uniref:Protein kinase domain-containing protein n=1 Tax=Oedothorax gibbosus TaxID=931172 RepID=A0AAV6V8V5_9ARAC|nr:hypothetical protein JTE90_009734 [Oedothorax gibbosus]
MFKVFTRVLSRVFSCLRNEDIEAIKERETRKMSEKIVKRVIKNAEWHANNMKKERNYWDDEDEEETENAVRNARKDIDKDYKHSQCIASGKFAEFHKYYKKKEATKLLCKIQYSQNEGRKLDMPLWNKVNGHPNVQPLIQVYWTTKTTSFLMPYYPKNIANEIDDMFCKKKKDGFEKVKKWLREVLSAMQYLESKGLCHLKLMSRYIFIAKDGRAVVGGLSRLNLANKPMNSWDHKLLSVYFPPEMSPLNSFDGKLFDRWAYGMLSCECLTYFALRDVVKSSKNWQKHVYPTMCYIMDEKNFTGFIRSAFPWGKKIRDNEAKLALNFVQGFLREDPKKRISPSDAMQHKFLGEDDEFGPGPDKMWTNHTFSFNLCD